MTRIAVALDYPSVGPALEMVDALGGDAGLYKVGLELFTRAGPEVVGELRARGKDVFLDLKLHDIPNTVAGAVEAAADAGVELLTIHAGGGEGMMRAAAEAAAGRVRLLGVTVLTSLSGADLAEMWGRDGVDVEEEVVRLAGSATEAGLDGVVASVREAERLKAELGAGLLVATPGIRLPGGRRHDQVRVATPGEAVRAGSDVLVVGRAVTAAEDPAAAFGAVRNEVRSAGGAGT